MSASKRVGGVDVTVAGNTESGCIGLASDVSGRLLADFADPNSSVTRGELVRRTDFGVTVGA